MFNVMGKGVAKLGAYTPPILTTAERLAIAASDGLLVFDSTLQELYIYEHGAWSAVQQTSPTSSKIMFTPEGGIAVKLTNKTGVASVKGSTCHVSTTTNNAVQYTPIGEPDTIGVMYEDGVADGAETWIVVSGIADVLFVGSTTREYLARTFISGDAGAVAGKAMAEPIPTSPFATDKHFAEIGHVLESRTGAGLAKCILHFN